MARSPRRFVVPLASTLVVISGALTTALLALVVEDLLPKTNASDRFVLSRWLITLAVIAAVLGAVSLRARVHRTTGTLFYVQLLDESMQDRRRSALEVAAAHKMSIRSVTRWPDLRSITHDGVIDAVRLCEDIGVALEEAVNTDRDDTGYTIAPNLLWPTALAVGGYLPVARDLKLLELPSKDTHREVEFPLRAKVDVALNVRTAELPVQANSDQASRIGVWLAFTEAAAHFAVDKFSAFGVTTVHTFTVNGPPPTVDNPPALDATQLATLPEALARHLVHIKNDANNRELVIVAMLPKTTAFALGWHLAQAACRFFHGTHLMHYDTHQRRYLPLRVRSSQPTHPPQPLTANSPLH